MTEEERPDRVLRLFVRADPQIGAERVKESVVRRLAALERDGEIDGFERVVWGKAFRPTGPLEGTEYHDRVAESLEEFDRWAAANGVSLENTFTEREVNSSLTEDSFTAITLPTMCLAEYVDGDLRGVYPCHEEGDLCRVTDFLDRYEAAAEAAPDGPARGPANVEI